MNEVERIDDAWSFYERSLGTLTSGVDEDAEMPRPSALHLASNIPASGGVESTWNGAGWVEVAYGASGNVTSFTVHGQCHDVSTDSCVDREEVRSERGRVGSVEAYRSDMRHIDSGRVSSDVVRSLSDLLLRCGSVPLVRSLGLERQLYTSVTGRTGDHRTMARRSDQISILQRAEAWIRRQGGSR